MSEKIVFSAKKGKQIAVFIENEPGTLAAVTEILGKQGINIFALTLAEGIDHGYVRMVVDRYDEARKLLVQMGQLVIDREVVLLELANKAGSLAAVTRLWAAAGINLEYAYCANSPGVDKGMVIVRVNDTDKAIKLLQEGQV